MAMRRAIVIAIVLCGASLNAQSAPANENSAAPAAEAGSPDTGGAPAGLVDLLASSLAQCMDHARRVNAAVGQKKVNFEPALAIKPARLEKYYPNEELRKGHQAIVLMEMLIDATGNARFVQVLRALPVNPQSAFAQAAIAAVRDMRFKAAIKDGQPVASWKSLKFNFLVSGTGHFGNILDDKKMQEYIISARKGDLKARAAVFYLYYVANPDVPIPQVEADRYLAEVALAGSHTAELQVAQRLSPTYCTKPPRIQELLRKQAWAGFSAAELMLATELLEAGDPASYHDIGILLHGAANSKSPAVELWATGLLATSPVSEIRDAPFALQMAQDFKDSRDPDELEALAAAQAANAQYAEATKTEERALEQANLLARDDVLLSRRLTTYQSDQPWIGYLCDCTQLVPGEGL
ncbi:MAG TPA: TonB family protein [Steroidobacteraceae bacterium]